MYFNTILLIIIFLVLCNSTKAIEQDYVYPHIIKEGQKITDFIPKDWTIRDSVSGDLNNDKRNDFVMILQRNETIITYNEFEDFADTQSIQPRILLILFSDKRTRKYQLIEQSNSFILRYEDWTLSDDPYQSISINKGILKIDFHLEYGVGSWYITNTSYKFRYQDKEFVLIGADSRSIHRASHEFTDYSFNFLLKKWSETKGNADSDEKVEPEWHSLDIKELKTLKTLKVPYTWEVAEKIFI